ncbi:MULTISPECIES: response regulator transcription factor [Nitrospirillum]|uniref:Phosphate regulon transcriptional regulatory protein PhoB n=1 Tax=Nitrospirillum amazonense TaxID=28077 RepID=A0A560FXZ3_9PROT|nr:response regulator transcription factor [Nitrospirillum amazonense]MEC4594236.1 response regulator transcription factor [Nitrospirillum amazonense]TWB26441.1 two-component system phosphate regulon response regulator OmpR [Nitrospirillum amazonense]
MFPPPPDDGLKRQGRILLVEDDDRLAPLVVRHLADSGFQVDWAADAAAADAHLRAHPVDLAVLDIMLPGEDGLSLCRRIRRDHDIGIIMVTARGQEADRIRGLDLGADDYLPKPYSLWELEARAKAVLRRCVRAGPMAAPPAIQHAGPFRIDAGSRAASLHGQALDLTRTEFDLLARLAGEPGRVFSRDMLLECVRGGETDAFDRAVDTHISNLRRKIGDDPKTPTFIRTVWGVGYRFHLS